jgi:hypothetical protein
MRAPRFHVISEFGLCILFGILLGSGCSVFKSEGRPRKYLFPKGYIGWVRINFKRNAPAPPIEDGFYVFKFPTTGEVIASNRTLTELGKTGAEFYYYSEDMRLTRMQPTSGPNIQDIDNLEEPRHYIFVGTHDEYLLYDSRFPSADEDDEPRIGLIKKEQMGTN